MIKKIGIILIINLLSSLYASDLKPRILIIPVENNTTSTDIYDTVCSRINDTLINSLKFLGKYEIKNKRPDKLFNLTIEQLQTYTKENYIDNVIYTTLETDEKNKIIIKTSLYESESNKILLSKEYTAVSLLDIFNTSDMLISDMLGNFSTEHIGFGGVNLVNTGEKGAYSVYINTAYAGDNLSKIPSLLNGYYAIEIVQKRFNKDTVIFRRTVRVNENEDIAVNFSIPLLMKYERSNVESVVERTEQAIYTRKAILEKVRIENNVLLGLMEDLTFCPNLSNVKHQLEQNKFRMDIEATIRNIYVQYNNNTVLNLNNLYKLTEDIEGNENAILINEYKKAMEKAVILKKLQDIRFISDKEYLKYGMSVIEDSLYGHLDILDHKYKIIYQNDKIYINKLLDKYKWYKVRKSLKFNKYFKNHYKTLLEYIHKEEPLDDSDFTELKRLYLGLKTDMDYI